MMSLWDALRMNMMISYQELVRTFPRSCTTIVAAAFALQAYLPDHVINFLGGRDGVNTLGNMAGSIKEIFAGSNRNIRHAPNIREEQIKRMNNDNNKDGIKG
ncbi:hypothetical protein ELJ38_27280 [Klebsiella pneumoniae]|nr:hypothetical protein [Klebsiella pneumoniae]